MKNLTPPLKVNASVTYLIPSGFGSSDFCSQLPVEAYVVPATPSVIMFEYNGECVVKEELEWKLAQELGGRFVKIRVRNL